MKLVEQLRRAPEGAGGTHPSAAAYIRAPAAADCNAATAGSVQEIPYTADYVFWR